MKKNLLILAIGVVLFHPFRAAVAGNQDANKATVINQYDSVVFDLSQAVIAGNKITFPVYFLSDDTINALDFSLKYDTTKLSYDTILQAASYLSPTFYQDGTKTIRFTSYALQNYGNDTPLVYLQFTYFSLPICPADLDSVKGYLNGTACSVKIPSSCLAVGVPIIDNKDNFIDVFPNPAQGDFTVINKYSDNYRIVIYDILGTEIYFENVKQSAKKFQLNLLPGIYFLRLSDGEKTLTQKLVIE